MAAAAKDVPKDNSGPNPITSASLFVASTKPITQPSKNANAFLGLRLAEVDNARNAKTTIKISMATAPLAPSILSSKQEGVSAKWAISRIEPETVSPNVKL